MKPKIVRNLGCALFLFTVLSGAQEGQAAPLTLQQAIDLALQHNPARVVVMESLREAEADSKVARSELLSKVSVSAYYNRLDPNRLSFAGASDTRLPSLFASEAVATLRFRQVLLDGRSWPLHQAAGLGVDAAGLSLVSSDFDVTFAVTVAYTRLVEAGKLVDVAQEALRRQVSFKELAQAFYEAGKTSHLDLLRAESQRTDAERALIIAQEAEHLAQIQLRSSLGFEMDRRVHPVDDLSKELPAPPNESEALTQALRKNPRLSQLRTQERQAEALVAAAQGEHLPNLSLQGSYGLRYRDVGGTQDEYVIGVSLDVPVFSGFATTGRIEKMEARQRQLSARRRALQDQLRVELRQALTSWRMAMANTSAAVRSVEVNQEALQAALSLYSAGKVTALEVLTSQSELLRAEANHVRALGDYTVARARFRLVIGSSGKQEMIENE